VEPEEKRAHLVLAVTQAVVLEAWPDAQLASLNLALTFDSVGRVPPVNHAYEAALAAHLIEEDGRPRDRESLMDALASVIRSRLDAGTWGKSAGGSPSPLEPL
jgi:hypothetical protein